MANDDPSIPAWQRATAGTNAESEPNPTTTPVPSPKPAPKYDLASAEASAEQMPDFGSKEVAEMAPIPTREEAKQFLEHPGTKNAAADDKIRFLEVKGVRPEDIEALIPEAKKIYAAERAVEWETARFSKDPQEDQKIVPPVITYPEFLVRRSKAPPLFTTEFVLNTMYATVGSFAAMYGLSKYVLGPMHEELSSNRHEFFSHTVEKLEALDNKLSKMVSTKPVGKIGDKNFADNASDTSGDSDPTELFHRDIGVQTSPPQSRRNSLSKDESKEAAMDPLTKQTNRLASLSFQVKELQRTRAATGAKEKEITDQLDSFSTYLNELMYSSPYHSYKSYAPSWSSQPAGGASDEFDKFKQEVRSMKGQMLSARNFPRGGG